MDPTINTFPNQNLPKKNKMLPMIVIGVVLAAVIGGYFVFSQPKKDVEEKKDVVVEEKTPSPTEKPEIDKSKVKIQVINGTGTPGQAGLVVDALKEAGYASENITTGNAEEFDNKTTTIEAKKDFEDVVKDIEENLKSTFDDITVKSTNLEADSDFDVVIVTGGKLFETPTPAAATPIPTSTTTTTPTVTPISSPTPIP